MPQISIVMPVRNSERFLAATVDSLRAQTLADWELIIVDGGSTDQTLSILTAYNDVRIRIFEQPMEITPARNFGIAQARAEWIAVHDSDDVSHPQRLEKQWAAVQRVPGAVLSYTDVNYIGNTEAAGGRLRFCRTQALLALRLCYVFPMVHTTVMFNKSAALAVGGYVWRWAEDYGLVGRLMEQGLVAPVPEKLVDFRLHPTSHSHKLMTEMNTMAVEIAVDNCRRLMRLSETDARRAHHALMNRGRPGQWSEWMWFLRCCIPRLQWKSAELYIWLGLQTLRHFKP